eukprot:m.328050 g.328050  ORF g.328050 m.328050 type:complete len:795 (+) comp20423_c0_seq1:157-2541(+)
MAVPKKSDMDEKISALEQEIVQLKEQQKWDWETIAELKAELMEARRGTCPNCAHEFGTPLKNLLGPTPARLLRQRHESLLCREAHNSPTVPPVSTAAKETSTAVAANDTATADVQLPDHAVSVGDAHDSGNDTCKNVQVPTAPNQIEATVAQTEFSGVADSDDDDDFACQGNENLYHALTDNTTAIPHKTAAGNDLEDAQTQQMSPEIDSFTPKKPDQNARDSIQASPVAPSPSRTRYAQVAKLVAENPEMKAWVQSLAGDLTQHNFVVTDNFLERDMAVKLAVEVRKAWKNGKLETGMLAGGRSGKLTKYTLENIRGDKVGWFSGDPCHDTSTGRHEAPLDTETTGRCWHGETLGVLMQRLGTLVQMVASEVGELQGIESRSEAMVTCYPGNGARYIKHCDNPHRNGRKLTVLYYLNNGWRAGDGGELRVYDSAGGVVRDIEPVLDRVVLFFSDQRVPHEVLPAHKERFAVTLWFYDDREKRKAEQDADSLGTTGLQGDLLIEQRRIENEIIKFEQQERAKATVEESIHVAKLPPSILSPETPCVQPPESSQSRTPRDPDGITVPTSGSSPSLPTSATTSAAPTAMASTLEDPTATTMPQTLDEHSAMTPTLEEANTHAALGHESVSSAAMAGERRGETTPPAAGNSDKTPQPACTEGSTTSSDLLEKPLAPQSNSSQQQVAEAASPVPEAFVSKPVSNVDRATIPEYTVVRQPDANTDSAECLVFKIAMPGVVRGGEVVLDVTPNQLYLSHSNPDYELCVQLDVTTDPTRVKAKFKKATSTMKATLPVVSFS